jgi:hypothetical protein
MICIWQQKVKFQTKNALIPPCEVCDFCTPAPCLCLCGRRHGIRIRSVLKTPSLYSFKYTDSLLISIVRSRLSQILVSHCSNSSPKEEPAQQLEYQTAEDHEPEETYSPLN